MTSSMAFSSFSLHRHPFFNLPSNSLYLTPPIRKTLTPNFHPQTLTLTSPDTLPAPAKFLPKDRSFTSIDSFNDALVALLVADHPQSALNLHTTLLNLNLSPDKWTHSLLIRSHCKNNDPFEAKKALDFMLQQGLTPNFITFTILIDSFCKRGRVQRAFEVLDLMKSSGRQPNVQTYNCLLKGLCFVGRIEEAVEMVAKMRLGGELPEPDVYSYTEVMDGLCSVGRTDEAAELLAEAIGVGLVPSVVTYNSLFIGYCKEGKPRKGLKLLRMMKERGCEPDYITFSSVLHGLLKWGFMREAYGVYRGMVGLGFRVDERMMNTLLRGLCRRSWEDEAVRGDAYEVFERMRGWGYEVYPSTQEVVIHTFCVGKEIDRALVGVGEMVSGGCFPRNVVVNRIVRGLCEEGRVGEAVSVLYLVYERRRMPSKVGFNILIDELSRRGDLMGAGGVYGFALKIGVIPHTKPRLVEVHGSEEFSL